MKSHGGSWIKFQLTACTMSAVWCACRALAAEQLPHLKWNDRKLPLLGFMYHAELRKDHMI